MRACFLQSKIGFDNRYKWYYQRIGFKQSKGYLENHKSKNTDAQIGYRKFWIEINQDSTLTNDFNKIIALQNKLNSYTPLDYRSVKYNPKYNGLFFEDYLEKKIFRVDYSRDIYFNLLLRIDSVYFNVVIPDRRLIKFSTSIASSQTPHYEGYAFKINNTFYYLLPPTKYAAYHTNELPFYMENQHVLHIPQNLNPPIDCDDYNNKANIIFQGTPLSNLADNYRQIIGRININVTQKSLAYNGKVMLNGQFSTLLRNFYQNKLIDPSISQTYSIRMSDDASLKSTKYQLLKTSSDYPFKTSFSANYEIENFDKGITGNGVITLKKWFHFVHPKSAFINSKSRLFTYVPDFLCSDKFKYQLVFDKPVEVLNLNDYSIDISNEYGIFHSVLVKIDDTNYAFDAVLQVNKETVDAYNILWVEDISKAIEKLQSTVLIFKQL